ncbi:CaiB/BaiF CoA transferase family protein [Actinacidiphila sp. bgisy145]|uniref:CaiB/BaiF CoA transferase family protein n=1 Tax=Actinacidiphila sp. bgisy145 TaxID=3413792 RepID=UPI003EBFC2EA
MNAHTDGRTVNARPHPSGQGPLSGLLVLDLSHALAGPHATMMLGDLGARVIKVEAPQGDETRGWGPPFARPPEPDAAEESTYFLSCNRNKESVTADLRTDQGRELVRRLARRADVVVENFRPGALDRLGLGIERLHELNPSLVVLSISGFGPDGPEGGRPGYDQIAQGEAGLMSLTGEPGSPVRTGLPVADLLAGVFGACAVLAALIERRTTRRGQVVRTSLLSALVGVHSFRGAAFTVAGHVPRATGNQHPSIAPYGLFHCADTDIQLAAGSQNLWRALARATGLDADDPRYATNAERVRHRDRLEDELARRFAQNTADHWLAVLAAAGVPAGRIRTIDDVYGWEQTRQQGLVIEVDHATLGRIALPGPPWRFDHRDLGPHAPPPTLGQHDRSVRAWLDHVDASDPSIGAAGAAAAGPVPGGPAAAGPVPDTATAAP